LAAYSAERAEFAELFAQNVQRQVERIVAEHEDRDTAHEKTSIGRPVNTERDGAPARTIFQTVLDSNLPPAEKTVERITDEAFVMVVAGGETTARALTNAVYHLLANPSWLRKIQRELDEVMFDPAKLASYAELEACPTLAAAIKETLRVSAPVTNRVQVLDPEHQLVFDKWAIPIGTPVSMSVPAIHLDPKLYPEPHTFNPGRFIGDTEEVQRANQYYMPFHRGTRNCVGQK
jgi:cytochrome P450